MGLWDDLFLLLSPIEMEATTGGFLQKRCFSKFARFQNLPSLHSKSVDWFLYEGNTGI